MTDEQLRREIAFIEEYGLAQDPTIGSLLLSIDPSQHSSLQERLRPALVARLAPYHAWHDKVPFATLAALDRGGILLGEQFNNHARITLGPELEHVLVYGPTGSGKSHLLGHLLVAILRTETT